MANFNKFLAIGNLVRDVDLRYTSTGKVVGSICLAISTKFSKDKEETLFLDCTVWEKQAEVLAEYGKQGKTILVEGRLRQESWEKDGQKRSKIVLNIEKFQFLNSSKPSEETVKPQPTGEINTGINLEDNGNIPF